MAQTGYTPIQLYYSTTASAVPTAGNLTSGELAINITDGKLYYKNNSGTVTLLAGSGGGGPAAGSNTQIQFNNSGVFGASSSLTWDGTYLTAGSIKDSALTSGRVTFAGASGLLTDDADLTFDGTTLSTAGLTASGTVTLSGGTANGVAYLNGSKVLTTGSALIFTGTNLGVGVNPTNAKLEVAASTGEVFRADASGGAFRIVADQTNVSLNGGSNVINSVAGTEVGRFTSTGLGIGTSSPSEKLVVAGGCLQVTGSLTSLNRPSSSVMDFLSGATRFFSIGANSSTYGSFSFRNATTTANTEVMAIDSAGNLGLGVTPSAWAVYKAYQVGWGALASYADNDTAVFSNAYFDGGTWRYIGNNTASQYRQLSGAHSWQTATSGTAGNAITFTQAMTLDASGNLGVGVTSPATRLEVNGVSEGEYFRAGGGTISARSLQFSSFTVSGLAGVGHQINVPNASGVLTFATGSTERARITSDGNLLVGTTTPAGASRLVVATTTAVDATLTVKAEAANYASIINIEAQNDNGAIYNYIASNTTSVTQHWKISGGAATNTMAFSTGGTERARITSGGNLLVGLTNPNISAGAVVVATPSAAVNSSGGSSGKLTFAYDTVVAAGATKYLRLQLQGTAYVGVEVTVQGDYGSFNAAGSYKKAYGFGTNQVSTTLFGYADTVMYNLGLTSTAFNVQTATKPNNNTVYIPITNTQAVAVGLYLTVEVYGGLNAISSVDVI